MSLSIFSQLLLWWRRIVKINYILNSSRVYGNRIASFFYYTKSHFSQIVLF